ncbi:MAG: hypothetical protein ABDH63_07675, partial [Candidatus Caldarchaeales archaeon]
MVPLLGSLPAGAYLLFRGREEKGLPGRAMFRESSSERPSPGLGGGTNPKSNRGGTRRQWSDGSADRKAVSLSAGSGEIEERPPEHDDVIHKEMINSLLISRGMTAENLRDVEGSDGRHGTQDPKARLKEEVLRLREQG